MSALTRPRLLMMVSGALSVSLLSGCPDFGERYAARELWLSEPLSWAELEPLFKRRCLGCHGPMPAGGATLSLSTYEELKPWLERVRVRAIVNRDMPPGGLQDPTERDQLARWLALGAPERLPDQTLGGQHGGGIAGGVDVNGGDSAGDEAGSAGAVLEAPTWSDVRSILSIYCNTCHAEQPTGGASFGLTTYMDALSRLEAIYDRVVMRQDMPPGGLRDADDLATLEAWLNAGGPE